MNLFNNNHYPVVEDDTKFDFYCALPKEDTYTVTIKQHSIDISPNVNNDSIRLAELTDDEKKHLFDVILKVDEIRLLGDTVTMVLSLADNVLMLHDLKIDKSNVAQDKVRKLVCEQCCLKDSVICYNKTLMEFMREQKMTYYYYEAVEKKTTKVYRFNANDVAQYCRKLQDAVNVKYSNPEHRKGSKSYGYTVNLPGDDFDIDKLDRYSEIFRSIEELYKRFPIWWL